MLLIPQNHLNAIGGAGPISTTGPATTSTSLVAVGVAWGSSSAFTAAGGFASFSTVGPALGGAAMAGLSGAYVLGYALGECLNELTGASEKLADWLWDTFGA